MAPDQRPRLLTAAEIADALQISPAKVYKLKSEGRIPHYRVGETFRFNLDEVLDALRSEPDPAVA